MKANNTDSHYTNKIIIFILLMTLTFSLAACGNTSGAEAGWICPSCGNTSTGKFCSNCGAGRPEDLDAGSEASTKPSDEKGNTGSGLMNMIESSGSSILSPNKKTFTFRSDRWNLYVATSLSEKTIKLEKWWRYSAGQDPDPFEHAYDLPVISLDDNTCDFQWLDDKHTVFSLMLIDENNDDFEEPRRVCFVKNETVTESSASGDDTVFIYTDNRWNTYVAVEVAKGKMKIENWWRYNASEDGDPFRYARDVNVISEGNSDTTSEYSWVDDTKVAFVASIMDPEGYDWDSPKKVSFTICPDFKEAYLIPAKKYESSLDEEEEESTTDISEKKGNKGSEESKESETQTSDEKPKSAKKESKSSSESETLTEGDFTYELSNGSLCILDYNGISNSITISSEVKGYPVVAIGDSAFENCSKIKNISIWADIESVGDSSFKGCSSLEDISLPNETKIVGPHAFEGCSALKDAILWGDPSIEEYAFKDCTSLTSISIGSHTDHIGAHAFEGCTALKEAIIWGHPSIEEYTFKGCTSLSSISISSDTDHIGPHAFEDCTAMDDVIFWGVNKIDEYAFAGCTSITSLDLPSELETIGDHAFDGCSSLKKVTTWNDDMKIGKDAFANCPKLDKAPT